MGQQSRLASTTMCTPSELLEHGGRSNRRVFAIEKDDGRRRKRGVSDVEALAGECERVCRRHPLRLPLLTTPPSIERIESALRIQFAGWLL